VLRTALRAAAVAVATAVALSVAPTGGPVRAASADPDPLHGLTVHPEWGSITGKGGVLKRGCRMYSFTYSITPPEGIWALEVFITGPKMDHVAGGAFLDGYDPTSGTGTYKLCRRSNHYGTYTIDAKVSVDNGYGETTEGRLPTDTYRLRRPHRHHHQH
jgi:hypothetical protein